MILLIYVMFFNTGKLEVHLQAVWLFSNEGLYYIDLFFHVFVRTRSTDDNYINRISLDNNYIIINNAAIKQQAERKRTLIRVVQPHATLSTRGYKFSRRSPGTVLEPHRFFHDPTRFERFPRATNALTRYSILSSCHRPRTNCPRDSRPIDIKRELDHSFARRHHDFRHVEPTFLCILRMKSCTNPENRCGQKFKILALTTKIFWIHIISLTRINWI